MGGSTGVMFASAYPEVVQKLMLIDIIKPVILPLPWLEQKLGTNIDSYLATEKSLADPKNRKGVPIEDLVARRVEVNNGGITPESARILMERGAKPVEGGKGLIFSHDLRMVRDSSKIPILPFSREPVGNFSNLCMNQEKASHLE